MSSPATMTAFFWPADITTSDKCRLGHGTGGILQFNQRIREYSTYGASGSSLLISPSGTSTLTITTTSLPGGTVGVFYSTTLAATGDTPPLTWSIISGSLCGQLALNSSTGVISGTPTTVRRAHLL